MKPFARPPSNIYRISTTPESFGCSPARMDRETPRARAAAAKALGALSGANVLVMLQTGAR